MEKKFLGYRRENARVGVRNHVVILPLDDLSNAACEAVANNVKGTLALPHAYGRLQFGEDLELMDFSISFLWMHKFSCRGLPIHLACLEKLYPLLLPLISLRYFYEITLLSLF